MAARQISDNLRFAAHNDASFKKELDKKYGIFGKLLAVNFHSCDSLVAEKLQRQTVLSAFEENS